jgi:hypothetical protein
MHHTLQSSGRRRPARARRIFALGGALAIASSLGAGCKKAEYGMMEPSYGEAYPDEAEYARGDHGGGGMDMDAMADVEEVARVSAEMSAAMPGSASGADFEDGMGGSTFTLEGANIDARDDMDAGGELGFRSGRSRSRASKKTAAAPASPDPAPAKTRPADMKVEPAGGDSGVSTDGEQQVATDEETPDDHGRQIIYTAGMTIDVWDVEDAMEKAMRMPDRFGGYVHMSRVGYIVLKIPAAKLRAAMDELQTWGVVLARQLQAQDVTAEYTDLVSRIRVLQETQAQLIELLKRAKSVEEALHVRKALDDVTMQLEVALGRMRQLSDSIAFSTLTVQLNERTPMNRLPSSNDPFRWVDNLGVEGTEWR